MTLRPSSKRLERSAELRSRVPVKRSNSKRKKSAFERCYHSKGRVEFVKRLHCAVDGCEATESVNAHVVRDAQRGMSRKAGYRCVAPLCAAHHSELDDDLGREMFEKKYGLSLQDEANKCEAAWQRFLAHGGEPFEQDHLFTED